MHPPDTTPAPETPSTPTPADGVAVAIATQAPDRSVFQELLDLRYALDEASIVAATDVRGKIMMVNKRFCAISGYSEAELLGQDHRLLNSGQHPKAFFIDMWRTIGAGKVWRGELCNRRKDGALYWVDTTIIPLLSADGKPYRYMAIRNDITARVAAERRLREQTALARLGEMASVVAHEVKNPLAGISGAIQIVRKRIPEGSQERAVLGDVLERITALNATMEDLLQYARPRPPQLRDVELDKLVASVMARSSADPVLQGVEVKAQVDAITLRADATMLEGALLNLVINAAQALGHRGSVRIGCRALQTTIDGSPAIAIEVVDDGPGIPAEALARVFEPFYTTRHRGTGLGLAVVQRVAEVHGGKVELQSTVGAGTVVRLVLPVSGPAT